MFIASGGIDVEKAEAALASGDADLASYGRSVLANPDRLVRPELGPALAPPLSKRQD